MDLTGPFRGSTAVAARLVTWGELRGPRFRRLFPDIYAPAPREPDLALRSRAAYLLVHGRGMLAGYSAAELLDASCGPPGSPATVLMRMTQQRRSRPGLIVHRDLVTDAETMRCGPCSLTTPVRTAFDLGRWAPTLTERVVAVDTLAHRHRFTADTVRAVARQHLRARGSGGLPRVLSLVDPRSESPMESRIRIALVLAGLPVPAVQHPVTGRGRSFRLDLAYPAVRLAIEYDGGEHRQQDRARRDLERQAILTQLGWTILRFDAETVLFRPNRVAADVRSWLQAA